MPDPTRLLGTLWDLAKAQRVALLVAGAAMVAGGWLYRAGVQAERDRTRAQAARVAIRTVVETLKVVEIQYRTDTIRLREWRTRWDTVARDVERWKHDTMRVVEYVQVADSTIRACTAALTTCERRVALEQQRAALLTTQLKDAERRARTQTRRRAMKLVGAAAAGLVVGRAVR